MTMMNKLREYFGFPIKVKRRELVTDGEHTYMLPPEVNPHTLTDEQKDQYRLDLPDAPQAGEKPAQDEPAPSLDALDQCEKIGHSYEMGNPNCVVCGEPNEDQSEQPVDEFEKWQAEERAKLTPEEFDAARKRLLDAVLEQPVEGTAEAPPTGLDGVLHVHGHRPFFTPQHYRHDPPRTGELWMERMPSGKWALLPRP